jgi:voltage-gated potassium channel
MATVGYGDVHAEGQVARAVVAAVIVSDVVVATSPVRAHTARRALEG